MISNQHFNWSSARWLQTRNPNEIGHFLNSNTVQESRGMLSRAATSAKIKPG